MSRRTYTALVAVALTATAAAVMLAQPESEPARVDYERLRAAVAEGVAAAMTFANDSAPATGGLEPIPCAAEAAHVANLLAVGSLDLRKNFGSSTSPRWRDLAFWDAAELLTPPAREVVQGRDQGRGDYRREQSRAVSDRRSQHWDLYKSLRQRWRTATAVAVVDLDRCYDPDDLASLLPMLFGDEMGDEQ